MEDLREAMPSIPHVLEKLHSNPDNNKLSMFSKFYKFLRPAVHNILGYILITGDQLERLLMLEYEFGTLPGFTPAVDAVIDFLTTVRSTVRII